MFLLNDMSWREDGRRQKNVPLGEKTWEKLETFYLQN
jgi:hypothetical protein